MIGLLVSLALLQAHIQPLACPDVYSHPFFNRTSRVIYICASNHGVPERYVLPANGGMCMGTKACGTKALLKELLK